MNYHKVNVAAQTGTSDSLLDHYRAWIPLCNKYSALQTDVLIPLKSNHPSVYTALRVDENGIFVILENLSGEAITKYSITLKDAGLAETVYSMETLFGAGQAGIPERSGGAFTEYKPFENLNPYVMYVIKINPK